MSTPSRIESKAVASSAADMEIVRLLAVLAKASFTYQENNRRTLEACSAFQNALIAREKETGAAFVLENRSDSLYTASGKVSAESLRDWLRSTLQRALLGAIRIEGEVRTPELQKFLAQLRSTGIGKIRKDATFLALWPERFDKIELRELRFFGGYHQHDPSAEAGARWVAATAPDGSADLRAALQRLGLSTAQLERILALEQRLAGMQSAADEGEPLSLPREVLAALPADVVDDPAARPVFVDRLLDRFEKILKGPALAEDGVPAELGGLVELFRKLPETFFTSEVVSDAPPVERPQPTKAVRPEDRVVEIEDPATLVALVAALPEKTIHLEPDEATLQAETLRVCLHQLGADTTPRVAGPAAAKVKKILSRAAPESLRVLEHYVRQVFVRGPELPTPAVVDRVLQRLDQHHLLPELRRQGGMTVERIVRFFPKAFVPFLKSLTEGSAADAEALVRTLKGLQDSALAAGAARLVQEKDILDPALLRKLFGLGGRSALGLARTMLSARNPAVQGEIVALLRTLGGDHAEAVPLLFLEAASLPVSFLQDLCDFARTGRPDARLRSQAGGLLYTFIESTPNDTSALPLKARAITGLAAFPGPSSEALLKREWFGRGLLGPLLVPKSIRDAVRETRARWKEAGHV